MYVTNVNKDRYTEKDTIIPNASCAMNCLDVQGKVIGEKYGIIEGLITSVHLYAIAHTHKTMHSSLNKCKFCFY